MGDSTKWGSAIGCLGDNSFTQHGVCVHSTGVNQLNGHNTIAEPTEMSGIFIA